MHWNFVKNVSKLPVGRIIFGPTRLMVALDISSSGKAVYFSHGPLTDTIGGCFAWASGMEPPLQCSAEASDGGPVTIAVGGVQPTMLSSNFS